MSDLGTPVGAACNAWCRRSYRGPIENGRPGPGYLAHVVGSNYADHFPLYRLEQFLNATGADHPRKLSQWNGQWADLLEPIARVMHREQVRQAPWIQRDDTTLDVQNPSRAPEIRTGHVWVYDTRLDGLVDDY